MAQANWFAASVRWSVQVQRATFLEGWQGTWKGKTAGIQSQRYPKTGCAMMGWEEGDTCIFVHPLLTYGHVPLQQEMLLKRQFHFHRSWPSAVPSQPHQPGRSLRSAPAGAGTCYGAGPSLSRGVTRWHLSPEQSEGSRARPGFPRKHLFGADPLLHNLHTPMVGDLPWLSSPRQLFRAAQSFNRTGKVKPVPAAQLSVQQPNTPFLAKTICLGVRKANAVPQKAGLVGCKGVSCVRQPAAQTQSVCLVLCFFLKTLLSSFFPPIFT